MTIHVVKQGDTVYSIANEYGVSPGRIISDNQILYPYNLLIGQAILILFPDITHVALDGETIYSISELYNVPLKNILRNNPQLIASDSITPGEEIVIKYKGEKIGNIVSNGYAYPFIETSILNESLVYLSSISNFSYGFNADGSLIPLDDEKLLSAAKRYGVSPILVLTPLDENGQFNSFLLTQLTQNSTAVNNLVENLLNTVKSKGYSGVDLDFEFVQPADKEGYINLASQLTQAMNPQGYTVSIALAPKTSDDQPGLLYEGIDYRRLGQIANEVLLMTYEWGYTYGPPMAVAPINKVKEVLDYAVSRIPREKINMGIPNYGYDWALPFVKGQSKARVIGNLEAIQIAKRFNSEIKFDTTAMSPYFEYKNDGISHIVWFEDARSINEKLKTAADYNFRGVGYWTIMKYFRQNWLILNSLFNIKP